MKILTVTSKRLCMPHRCYVAHLMSEKGSIDEVLGETDGLLRNTYGYCTLRCSPTKADQVKADALLKATRGYVHQLAMHPENAALADSTGFAPEGVRSALLGLGKLERKLTPADCEDRSPIRCLYSK